LPRWKKILFTLIMLSLVALVLEVGARIGLRIFRGFDGSHLYQYEFDPYRNIHPTPNFVDRRGVRHNSVGFRRSSEVEVAKPAGTYRIFLMGASTAYGLGGLWPHIQRDYAVLDNSQTIDAYLQAILGDSVPGARVEVINAAVTSTWTHHHLIYLNQRLLGYDPDMVLFLDGFNDFFFANRDHDQFASYSYGLPSRVIMGDPSLYALAYANSWWLFRKSAAAHVASRLGQTIKRALSRSRPPTINADSAVARLRDVFPRNALKMHERSGLILQAESVRTVFMLQPLLILERQRRGMPPIERQLFDFNVASWPVNYEEFSHRAMPFIRERETAMAARVGATFLDLSQPFDGVEEQVYTDYAHLTPRGNELLAQRIAAHVLPMIRADVPPSAVPAATAPARRR
jgi:lysophospholipase L1-like esterase